MVMGTGRVVYSTSHRVRINNRSMKLVTGLTAQQGNGGDGGDASSGNAVAVSDR